MQVSVNGQNVALTAADPTIPVFTGKAETGSDTKYKYVVAGKAEPFDRALPTGASTYNDFYERPVTYANIPELPWPIEENVSNNVVISNEMMENCLFLYFGPFSLFPSSSHDTPQTLCATRTELDRNIPPPPATRTLTHTPHTTKTHPHTTKTHPTRPTTPRSLSCGVHKQPVYLPLPTPTHPATT